MIQGGEEFIWAAYGISWAGFAIYGWSLYSRLKAAEQEDDLSSREGEA
jgi:hypothetical protein